MKPYWITYWHIFMHIYTHFLLSSKSKSAHSSNTSFIWTTWIRICDYLKAAMPSVRNRTCQVNPQGNQICRLGKGIVNHSGEHIVFKYLNMLEESSH